jgi:hypothetical protein
MKVIKSAVIGIAVASVIGLSTAAYAGKAIGTVKLIYTQGTSVYISINGYDPSIGTYAFCSTFGEFAFDGSTSTGKNLYAMLLTARALDATVAFTGTGTCTVASTREDVSYGALTSN